MSDYGDLFTSFYNQFILRDLLSIVLPGFIVIVSLLTLTGQNYYVNCIFSSEISPLCIFLILAFSYILGIIFLSLSDITTFCRTYYGNDPTEMKRQTKRFYEKLDNNYHEKQSTKDRFANIRERFIIFMQATGNMAWASLTIIFFNFFILLHGINNIWAIATFGVIFVFATISNCLFRKYLEDWDTVIIDC
jgi:hypothetical protein